MGKIKRNSHHSATSQALFGKLLHKKTAIATLLASLCCVAAPTISSAAEVAGKTIIARGGVNATQSETSQQRKLKRRSPIFDVDVVKTDDNSKAQLRMIDGGMIALKENSELVIAKYDYNAKEQTGSIALELLKGGLRSVTGAIKAEKGNYQLSTPIGSIGIRGTHYEIEIVGGLLFIAVWDGAIDVSVEVGGQEQSVSLGEDEDYAYASVDEEGTVTPMLEPPANFEQGHSSDPATDAEEPADTTEQSETATTTEVLANAEVTPDAPPPAPESEPEPDPAPPEPEPDPVEPAQDEQEEFVPVLNLAELVLARTGTVSYNQISDLGISNLAGQSILNQVSGFEANLTVNFTNATIPTGHVSFTDNGGEWFAAFNGIINKGAFEIDVNFASHGNNLADGDVSALFKGDLDTIFTNFDLAEINNPNTGVKGSFTIR